MRLKQVKLSGFKSFANPVSIHLHDQMVAIAGPNGCGKSNIVDAVRWVMGETSRHIRASGNEDVIFNGSRLRKPLGQASVELVFDNGNSPMAGQYAGYDELSLRRTFARDQGSVYYINNTRCRRRDIMDIFLGTGLGAHSYAIIEQGMISRIVEARPEEVRAYVEEAAGVSRYKQRRHETELKIRHTHDNLSRVLDIRGEVDKQIERLDRQAKAAERYRQLQREKRQAELQAGVLELKLKKEECERTKRRLLASDEQAERRQAALKKLIADGAAQRQEYDEVSKRLRQAHASVYRIDADIQIMGRDLSRHEEDNSRLGENRQQLNRQLEENRRQLAEEKEKAAGMERRRADTEQKIVAARQEVARLEAQQASLEKALEKLSDTRERGSGDLRHLSERVSAAKSKIAFCEEEMVRLEQNRLDVISQQSALAIEALRSQEKNDRRLLEQKQKSAQLIQKKVAQTNSSLESLKTRSHEINEERNACQVSIHELQGRIASTETIYEAGLGHDTAPFVDWVKGAGLSRDDFLSENISVESGWELAVEMALGTFLEGLQVASIDKLRRHVARFKQGRLCLLESASESPSAGHPSLADKVRGCPQLAPFLQSIRIADSKEDAMRRRHQLSAHESVITADGLWLNRHCLRLYRPLDSERLSLSGRRQLNSLRKQHKRLQETDRELEETIKKMTEELSAEEARRTRQQERHAEALSELARLETRLTHNAELMRQKNKRHEELLGMLENIRRKSEQIGAQQKRAQSQYDEARQKLADFHSRHEELSNTRSARQAERDDLEKLLNSARRKLQQLEISRESHRYAVTAANDAIKRLTAQGRQLAEQSQQLADTLMNMQAPLLDSKKKMEELNRRRAELGGKAEKVEASFAALQKQMEDTQNKRLRLEENIDEQRLRHEKIHAQLEVSKARLDDLRRSLSGFSEFAEQGEEALLSALPEELTVSQSQKDISSLRGKIERLGAINLAALDEHSELSERKEYLDSQCQDLQNALKTLDEAVRRIDDETKERFVSTVEKINENLQETFPSLFGGGSSHLRLTDKDPLSAGVTIMSQPPGKRLSSIRLLSGGEKTLSAIALVFAIFNLNPAPFCLLDEVDAPLDEHNLERFCQLLRAMSENVQIIIITHNKISMENMSQLIGVTMQEAGVSRQVSINLEEADSLIGA